MAFTQQQLNALDAAIASGTMQVMYGNKTVMYKSLDEMLRVRRLMAKELGLLKEGGDRKTIEFNNGLK